MRAGKRFAVVDTDDQNDLHARDVVEWWRREHVAPMLAVRDLVSEFAPQLELGDGLRIQAVSYRAKRFDTTIEKLTREPGKLAAMADIAGVRAVVNVQGDADAIAARIDDVVEVRRVRDWAREPRSTGYRALHLHVRHDTRLVEVQLRTFGQDAWANLVRDRCFAALHSEASSHDRSRSSVPHRLRPPRRFGRGR